MDDKKHFALDSDDVGYAIDRISLDNAHVLDVAVELNVSCKTLVRALKRYEFKIPDYAIGQRKVKKFADEVM